MFRFIAEIPSGSCQSRSSRGLLAALCRCLSSCGGCCQISSCWSLPQRTIIWQSWTIPYLDYPFQYQTGISTPSESQNAKMPSQPLCSWLQRLDGKSWPGAPLPNFSFGPASSWLGPLIAARRLSLWCHRFAWRSHSIAPVFHLRHYSCPFGLFSFYIGVWLCPTSHRRWWFIDVVEQCKSESRKASPVLDLKACRLAHRPSLFAVSWLGWLDARRQRYHRSGTGWCSTCLHLAWEGLSRHLMPFLFNYLDMFYRSLVLHAR